MVQPRHASTEELVELIVRETKTGSVEGLNDLSRRVAASRPDEQFVNDLAQKNPALLGTGEVS